ncbi:MAG: MATE family efflux transporter, partial [Oscillospiraceae bacterium]|nr:MATE family efflux transporter [Oscillospiraceae bacterium]
MKEFAKYVSFNILGMLGISCYILADTYFIAQWLGADGITALNLVIPAYNFINGLALMLGMGGCTK